MYDRIRREQRRVAPRYRLRISDSPPSDGFDAARFEVAGHLQSSDAALCRQINTVRGMSRGRMWRSV